MPANRNALLRYKTIDKCLRNRARTWTLQELIEEVSEALYEFEGIDRGIGKRTIQQDIQIMRSDRLGYNAPIVVEERKYYTYSDPDYSITNIPLTTRDLDSMATAIAVLRQFKGFSAFSDLNGMVHKLEDRVASIQEERTPVILLEKNDRLKGLQFLDQLYTAIAEKQVLKIRYQSFEAQEAQEIFIHPYYLKEYQNRWYLLGYHDSKHRIVRLGLDRMISVSIAWQTFRPNKDFNPEEHFRDVVGVTVYEKSEVEEVRLCIDAQHAAYHLTKPLHHSQQLIEKTDQCVTISIQIKVNYELEREIIAQAERMQVVSPLWLKEKIEARLKEALRRYQQ